MFSARFCCLSLTPSLPSTPSLPAPSAVSLSVPCGALNFKRINPSDCASLQSPLHLLRRQACRPSSRGPMRPPRRPGKPPSPSPSPASRLVTPPNRRAGTRVETRAGSPPRAASCEAGKKQRVGGEESEDSSTAAKERVRVLSSEQRFLESKAVTLILRPSHRQGRLQRPSNSIRHVFLSKS